MYEAWGTALMLFFYSQLLIEFHGCVYKTRIRSFSDIPTPSPNTAFRNESREVVSISVKMV